MVVASTSDLISDITSKMLAHLAVEQVFYSPGFRNSPLLHAFSRSDEINLTAILDERGMAFAALGFTKKTSKPCVVCVTSGTAVGNLLPAIMEAHKSLVPIIVLTADRERHEHRINTNQTIEQANIFKPFVRHSSHFEVKNDINASARELKRQILTAYQKALGPSPGPVHVNIAIPDPGQQQSTDFSVHEDILSIRNVDFSTAESSVGMDSKKCQRIIDELGRSARSAIIVGTYPYSMDAFRSISKIAKETESAVVCEKLYYSYFLQNDISVIASPSFLDLEENDFKEVLYLGYDMICRESQTAVRKISGRTTRLSLAEDCLDSELLGNEFWNIEVNRAVKTLSQLEPNDHTSDIEFLKSLSSLQREKESSIKRVVDSGAEELISEPRFHRFASKHWQNNDLFLSNSMVPRDFSIFSDIDSSPAKWIYTNRGVSGIDGILHTCFGINYRSNTILNLVIGDLSFLHDLSALSALNRYKDELSLNIWVLNNCGGDIFRNVADSGELLTTPFSLSFSELAKSAGFSYEYVKTMNDCQKVLHEANQRSSGISLFEILIDPKLNAAHRKGLR